MIRNILLVLLTLVIAIIGGALSVSHVLKTFDGFGRLQIGQWEAYPDAGTENADAYARARAAQRGDIAIGRAEGLIFHAWRDDHGEPFKAGCTYRLSGDLPEARMFTLYAATPSLRPIVALSPLPVELSSQNILRRENSPLVISIGPDAQPGNWLAIDGKGRFTLILTLYDTPIAATTGLAKLVMPRVERIMEKKCD